MSRRTPSVHPVALRQLRGLGDNIRLARLRRRFSATLVAERAGITRGTLGQIEKGEPTVSMGAYLNVLHSLGQHADLELVARDDELGRKLQDLGLTTKQRAPKKKA